MPDVQAVLAANEKLSQSCFAQTPTRSISRGDSRGKISRRSASPACSAC